MSSINHLQYLQTSTKLFRFYQDYIGCCYPYKFNFGSGYLQQRKDFFAFFLFPFAQFLIFCYCLFLWNGLYLNTGDYLRKKEYFEFCFHSTWCCCWGIGASIQIHLFATKKSLASFHNQTLTFYGNVSRKLGPRSYLKMWKIINFFQILIPVYMLLIPGFSAIIFIPLRLKKWNLFSYFPPELQDSTGLIIFIAFYEFWIIAIHMPALGLQVFVGVMYLQSSDITLKLMRGNLTSSGLKVRLKIYSQLRILNKSFNLCFGNSLIPCLKLTLGLAFILCTTGVVKLLELRDPILLGLLGVIAIFSGNMLLGLGIVTSTTETNAQSFLKCCGKNVRKSSEENRLLIAQRTFGVEVLGLYTITRIAPLNIIHIASAYIMTILVMFPHKLRATELM